MRILNWFQFKRRTTKANISLATLAGVACACGGLLFEASEANGQLVEVASDDFEGLTLQPFDVANIGNGDGTDWTNQIRTGTPRAWTIDNSLMGDVIFPVPGGVCEELAYNGWTAMDVDSWIDEQGGQSRSNLGAGTHNTLLVADPDAYFDYDNPEQPGGDTPAYTSYISRSYDLTGFDETTMSITLDWEIRFEPPQRNVIDVSFDDGTTWQNLLELDTTDFSDGELVSQTQTWVAGTDFTATSKTMLLRFGCIEANNDWWFAIDNVDVATTDGFSDFEDFEGLTLEPFGVAAGTPPGDGTDYTRTIPNWTVDNSGMLGVCTEGAFDGWGALDSDSWVNQQGGDGRTILSNFGDHNTLLVADGDAFDDFEVLSLNPPDPVPDFPVNTYISRTYNLAGFNSETVQIYFEYEFRIENQQRGVAEVSFNNGATWQTLLDIDDTDGANNEYVTIENRFFEPFVAGVDFDPVSSNSMILRFGYLNAGNNWWFAIDNIKIEAEEGSNVTLGDANGDGNFDFGDIEAFFLALTDPAAYATQFPAGSITTLDMNADSNVDFGDIDAFFTALTN